MIFIFFIIQYIHIHTHILNMNIILPEFESIPSFEKKYISVKGHVQSGKTLFMIHACKFFIQQKLSCVFVLRNSYADREQLYNRLTLSYSYPYVLKKVNGKAFPEKKQNIPHILFSLGNSSNLKKLGNKLQSSTIPFVLFIDEVDAVDYGSSIKMEYILDLKQKSYCTFGISATIMDTLFRENITPDHLLLLRVPQNYKGILKINMVPFFSDDSLFSSKKQDDLFDFLPDLEGFIEEYVNNYNDHNDHKYNHPRICLFNISRCIEPYDRLQTQLNKKYKNIVFLVYNGYGVSYKKGDVEWTEKITISKALQTIKDTGEKNSIIFIFSGDLAGRGISFVSEDYGWHLTDEVLIVSDKTDEPDLIQKVRLCGCYDDTIPLTLYSKEHTINDLKKAFYKQEEYLAECSKYSNEKNEKNEKKICRSIICEYPMTCSKFTSRKMTKDHVSYPLNKVKKNVGWSYSSCDSKDVLYTSSQSSQSSHESYESYDKKEENKEGKYEIIKINKKMTGDRTTIESVFLSMLSIEKEYTTDELIELLKNAGYQQPKSMFKVMTTPDKNDKNDKKPYKRYGTHYFDKVNKDNKDDNKDNKDNKDKIWKIRECLHVCWKM